MCPQPNANVSHPGWPEALNPRFVYLLTLWELGSTGDVVCTAVGSLSTCSLAHSLCLHLSCCSLQQTGMEHHSSNFSPICMARGFPVSHWLLGSPHLPEGRLPSEPSKRHPAGSTDFSIHSNRSLVFRCARTLIDTTGTRKKKNPCFFFFLKVVPLML